MVVGEARGQHEMRYCDICGLPIGFEPVWRDGKPLRWKALNPDGSPHSHSYQENYNEVPWQ